MEFPEFDERGEKGGRWLKLVAVEVEVDMPNRVARGSLVSASKRSGQGRERYFATSAMAKLRGFLHEILR